MRTGLFVIILFAISMAISGQKIHIEPAVSMLALGDSYTIGESVVMDERWPHQFVAALKTQNIKAEEPDYIARTGWTTQQLIQGIDIQLDRDKSYNLVSILIGVNNQYQGLDISIYKPELEKIIKLALAIVRQDASKIFIVSIPDYAFTPFGEGKEAVSKKIDEYNAINRELAGKYNISHIDITPISRTGLNKPSLVAGDGLHPSGKQYELWAEAILSFCKLPSE